MRRLIIMQGIPGSGKTTVANAIKDKYDRQAIIVSADFFWYDVVGNDPTRYDFDPSRRGEAHEWAQRNCRLYMEARVPVLIVDNTNIIQDQANPYLRLARDFRYNSSVVRVEASLDECIYRQLSRSEDRRVPEEVIRSMYERMERIVL